MTMLDQQLEFFERLEGEGWYRDALSQFAAFTAPQKEMRVLDVGCGTGTLARILAGMASEVVGVDSYPPVVRRAQEITREQGLQNITFQEAEPLSLPFPAYSFDLAVSVALLACVPDPLAVLREMGRVTRLGGSVASLNPSVKMSPPMALRYAREHRLPEVAAEQMLQLAGVMYSYHHFTPEALALLCEECGLRESQMESKMDGLIIFAKGKKS